jgi:hypothetical protein
MSVAGDSGDSAAQMTVIHLTIMKEDSWNLMILPLVVVLMWLTMYVQIKEDLLRPKSVLLD